MMMIIVGVDLAPKHSGLAVIKVEDYSKPINLLTIAEMHTQKQDIVTVNDFASLIVSMIKVYDPVLWVIEAPTQQVNSMVNVDVGFNLGVLSFVLYRYWQSFILVEPGKLYKWCSTSFQDEQRKNKVKAYVQQFFPMVTGSNLADALCHAIIGMYFVKYGEQMLKEDKLYFETSLNKDQKYVLSNKQRTGLFDQEKYFVNLALVDQSIAFGKESNFYFYKWKENFCGKVVIQV